MSVLIKGMEKPQMCDVCEFCLRDISGYDWCCLPMTRERNKPIDEPGMRPSWCPLVEVPPHGRLVDADELREIMAKTLDALLQRARNGAFGGKEMHILSAFYMLFEMINDAETIIDEEDEEKENET